MKRKIAVYAIAKNEEPFVDRWFSSMREADEIVVLDTGSVDGTVAKLKSLGAKVYEKEIVPWRFDEARNEALSCVAEDIDVCVATDLDEIFSPGWRNALEKAWTDETRRARFKYVWSFLEDGSEGTVLWLDKIHARRGYKWHYPVHEALVREGGGFDAPNACITVDGMTLFHHPDKTKSRAQYLPLLELSARENPTDARALHYLGREYMYSNRWQDAIDTLKKHIALPGYVWPEEKSASLRYMGRCYSNLGQPESAEEMFLNAVMLCPHLREGYYELAQMYHIRKQFALSAFFAARGLEIKNRPDAYMSESDAWNGQLERVLRSSRDALESGQ
ncbi:MAG: glycosyltransferase [Clostridia bacterium]|nr:glycosyltransferase [Clostridia bacterium]